MAETRFTKSVKYNLADYLNIWLKDIGSGLIAKPEYSIKSHLSKNIIDVALIDPNNLSKIVAIEIEVKSNPDQILTNRRKFKEWVHASPNRKGGMLHLIFSKANITQKRMYRLLRDSYSAIASGNGFFYEFMAIEADYRESKETAAVPDIPLGPVFRGYEESAFVNFLEQSHDGTAGWPRYGGPPATGKLTH